MKLLLRITYSNFFYFFQNGSKGFCQLLRLYDRRVQVDTMMRDILMSISLENSQYSFRQLYELYGGLVYRYVGLYIRDRGAVDEIVSDVFMALWNNRRSLQQISNFQGYVYRIAKFKAVDYIRKDKSRMTFCNDDMLELFAGTETSQEDDCISDETVRELNSAIETLPPKCRMAFKLVREDKMKYKDAAELMDISVKTLESHIRIAMKKIFSVLGHSK